MTHNELDSNTTLVVGGTGKTGRRVAERLQAQGLSVRIGSRSAQPSFDWENQDTWAPALRGISAVYLTYYPDLAVPGAAAAIEAFTRLAKELGVRRVVLLSGRNEPEAQAAERVVQAAGMEWVIVRVSWFNQNFSENYLLDSVLAGEIVIPAGDVQEPFVDADDIADVAVAALTDDRHIGQAYELTGPRLLSFAQVAAEISQATGRTVSYIPVALEDYASTLKEHGLPEDVIALLMYVFSEVLDGRNAHLTDGVQRALGREPRDFADYARITAETGVWNA